MEYLFQEWIPYLPIYVVEAQLTKSFTLVALQYNYLVQTELTNDWRKIKVILVFPSRRGSATGYLRYLSTVQQGHIKCVILLHFLSRHQARTK